MSIVPGVAETPIISLNILLLTTAVALAAAATVGFFSPRLIVGPSRLGEEESTDRLLAIGGVGLMSWFVATVACTAIRQFLYMQKGWGTVPTQLSPTELVVINIVAALVAFIAMLTTSIAVRKNALRWLGLDSSRFLIGVFRGFAAIIIVLPIVITTMSLNEFIWSHLHLHHAPEHMLLTVFKDTSQHWLRAAVVFSAVVAAPLNEELFFRGYLQTFIRYLTKSHWVAVIITSILFAAVHPWWTMPSIFVLSIGLGYLYERWGNLWACITLHALFNSASIALFYLELKRGSA